MKESISSLSLKLQSIGLNYNPVCAQNFNFFTVLTATVHIELSLACSLIAWPFVSHMLHKFDGNFTG